MSGLAGVYGLDGRPADLVTVDLGLFRHPHRLGDAHDADRLPLDSNEAHLGAIDLAVDAYCFVLSYAKNPLKIRSLEIICAPPLRPSSAK